MIKLPSLVRLKPGQGRELAAAGLCLAVLLAAPLLEPPSTASLALALSVPAFAIAVLALARMRLLEFCPEVLGGDVILPRSPRSGGTKLLLPLQFTNAGYADGVVEWIALRLTPEGEAGRSVLLSPAAEVDMPRFIAAGRRLTDENVIEPFTGFALEGKRALAKFVLFDVAERPRAAPLQLRPGGYGFELFIKASNSPRPRLARAFEHRLEPQQLEDFGNDSTVYLINYQVTLPAVRRALAGSEWLPRESSAHR